MALNVKAALLICMGFIGGMSWVVQRVGAPVIEVPSPLAPRALADAASGAAAQTPEADWRAARVGQLARRNMVDTELAANRVPGEAVTLAPHTEIPVRIPSQPELPPLVYDSGMAVADAAELDAVPVAAVDAAEVVLIAGAEPTEPMITAAADPAVEEVVAAATPGGWVYRVAKGDTLTRIVRRECNSDDRRLLALVVDANPKLRARGGKIMAGEDLLLPDPAAVQRVLAGEVASGVAPVAAAAGEVPAKTGGERWYTIQRNDTLERIAQRYLKDGRRWREIAALNRALDPHKIVPGTRIKLPPVIRLAQR